MLRSAPSLPRLAAAGLTLAASVAVLAGSASAAPAGGLTFAPGNGHDWTPMAVVAPGPCPSAATNILATAAGHGFPAEGQVVVTNTTTGLSHDSPFVAQFQDTFSGFAADNGTTLSGPYVITLRCIDALATKTYASWSGTMTFGTPTSYRAPAPSPALVAELSTIPAVGALPGQPGQPGAAAQSAPGAARVPGGPAASPGPAGAGPRAGQRPGAGPASPGTTTGDDVSRASEQRAAAGQENGPGWQPWLIVLAVLLIGGAVVARIRGRIRRPSAPAAINLRDDAVNTAPTTTPRASSGARSAD